MGLFVVENEDELNNIVSKTISTETNISKLPKKYFAHAGSREPLWPWPVEFNEEILTEMNTKYFANAGYQFSMATANDDTPNDALSDVEMINKGIKYLIYHGHGMISKWSFGMGVIGLSYLNNTVYPIVLSFSCLVGTFSGQADDYSGECYATKMMASPNGASAFLGAYNTSGRGQNALLEGLCNGLFNRKFERLGDAIIFGFNNTSLPNTVMKYYPVLNEVERTRTAWQFHLFGDPALRIKETTTSAENLNYNEKIQIYPNPSSGIVNISIPFKYNNDSVAVYDSTGKKVHIGISMHQLDFTNLPNGIYLISVKNGGVLFNEKIAIKN